jgi:hypothetical protein
MLLSLLLLGDPELHRFWLHFCCATGLLPSTSYAADDDEHLVMGLKKTCRGRFFERRMAVSI